MRTGSFVIPCLVAAWILMLSCMPARAQFIPSEELIFLTAEWDGERYPDGRPRVPDGVVERMHAVTLEEAWSILRQHGYHNQFAGNWEMIHDDVPVVGRALTAVYIPSRPEVQQRMLERGHENGHVGPMNSWPIDMLQPGDVYVADGAGKIDGGTLIGDNLGTAIFTRSGNGVVFHASVRDLETLSEIEGFNAFVRGWHPSYLQEMMLSGVNVPIRIEETIVMPGDVVLAKRGGIVFVPAHLAEEVVERAEVIQIRDAFAILRIREGRYTPGQIDTQWTEEITDDFYGWLEENVDQLRVPEWRVREMLEGRHW